MRTVQVSQPTRHIPNIWSKKMKLASVVLCGRQGNVSSQIPLIMKMGRRLGARKVHILRPPAEPKQPGWHRVVEDLEFASQGVMTFAEGGVLPGAGHCMMIPTRDCYVVYLENMQNGRVGATHAGRESLIKPAGCCDAETVVHSLLHKLEVRDGKQVHAYITGGISAKNFPHADREKVQPFIDRYGDRVITDQERLTLDLLYVIQIILNNWGVPNEQIMTDGLCTFDEPSLGSRRGDRPEQNWVFIH